MIFHITIKIDFLLNNSVYVYIYGKLSYENIYKFFIRILLQTFINHLDYYLDFFIIQVFLF